MTEACLEVTFRRGVAIAAYYYFPRKAGEKNVRSTVVAPGIVVDYARGGRPIGIEIIEPKQITLRKFNRILRGLGLPATTKQELAPLTVA